MNRDHQRAGFVRMLEDVMAAIDTSQGPAVSLDDFDKLFTADEFHTFTSMG